MSKMIYNDFYCIKCGKRAMSLPRKRSHQHKSLHCKKLYCPSCKITINCVECKNEEDVLQFKENFKKGIYEEMINYEN